MKKLIFGFVFLSFFLFPSTVSATLLSVKSDGTLEWKVLSLQDELALGVSQRNLLEVKDVKPVPGATDSRIVLRSEEGKTLLAVGGESDSRGLDVTGWEDTLIEVEERGDTKRMNIKIVDGNFAIEQDGIVAKTSLPINIDPVENAISLTTDSGEIFLSVLPVEAAETALRSRFISSLNDNTVEISQEEMGVLTYKIDGEKKLGVLKLLDYGVPVTAHVSGSTGEIVFVDQPTWLRILGFLF